VPDTTTTLPIERVDRAILVIRGEKVMLSTDLAALYEVEPRTLVQAVKRNPDRFPPDFMFQLTWEEVDDLRSQSVILKRGTNVKYLPYAFTEQGVAMLSSVLRSKRAIQVNVEIMRTFVRLRQMLATHKDLARKIEALEKKYDAQLRRPPRADGTTITDPAPGGFPGRHRHEKDHKGRATPEEARVGAGLPANPGAIPARHNNSSHGA